MILYKFIKIKDPENPYEISNIKFETRTESLPELLEEFELFLKACGYAMDGKSLEVVDSED